MADPLTILGTASSVAALLGILGRTITTLSGLRGQWKDADLTVLTFETQLIAMRAALTEIDEWAASIDGGAPHHQLVMDLDRCLTCCQLLMEKVNAGISEFHTAAGGTLDGLSRLRLLVKAKGIEDMQRRIEIQTAALNLLLTACNSNTLEEQRRLLEEPQPRQILKRVQDDAASMMVLRDADSIKSKWTGTSITSSRRSLVFDFDRELLVSGIYQRWIRGSVKRSLRKQQEDSNRHSRWIDLQLEQERRQVEKQSKILMLPLPLSRDSSRPVHAVIKGFRMLRDQENLVKEFRSRIQRNLVEDAKAILLLTDEAGNNILETDTNREHVEFVANYNPDPDDFDVDPHFGEAVAALWNDPGFQGLMERRLELGLEDDGKIFLSKAEQVCSADYEPSNTDIFQCREADGVRVTETRMLDCNFTTVTGEAMLEKWMRQSENIDGLVYVVDLAGYDKLADTLRQFDEAINTRIGKSTIFLLVTSPGIFRARLSSRPLVYTNVSGFDRGIRIKAGEARAHIEELLAKAKRESDERSWFSFAVEATDMRQMGDVLQNIVSIAKDAARERRLERST